MPEDYFDFEADARRKVRRARLDASIETIVDDAAERVLGMFASILSGELAPAVYIIRDQADPGTIDGWRLGLARVKHPPADHGAPPSADTRLILAGLLEVKHTMTKTTDALGRLTAADEELKQEVALIVQDVDNFPSRITEAVTKALAAAGIDDETAAAAIDAATETAKGLSASIKARLEPTPPAVVIVITPTSISGVIGQALTGLFSADGGAGPYTFSSPDAPAGLTVSSDGSWSASLTDAATGAFSVVATDAEGAASAPTSVSYSFSSAAPAGDGGTGGGGDGTGDAGGGAGVGGDGNVGGGTGGAAGDTGGAAEGDAGASA